MIFIVGVGRSGTSLLQSMLHSHPSIRFLPETQFLRNYVLTKKKFKNTELLDSIKYDPKFNRYKLNKGKLKNTSNPLHLYKSIIDQYSDHSITYVGEKDPRMIDYLPRLKNYFPKAKVLHIIRDPRDVVLSRTKAEWSKKWPFFLHAYLYNAQLERGRNLGKICFAENYNEIYYEQLIDQPKETLIKICKFLDIPFNPEMLNFGKHAKGLVDEKEIAWKKETLGPLLNKNKEKWKKELTDYQIRLIQMSCKKNFTKHPYQLEKLNLKTINRFNIFLHKIGSFFFKEIYPLRIK